MSACPLQERLAPPELEGHASLSRVMASMLRAADMRPLASKPSCPLYTVITQVQHSKIEGSTSLTVARHSRPQLSQRMADLSNALHGSLGPHRFAGSLLTLRLPQGYLRACVTRFLWSQALWDVSSLPSAHLSNSWRTREDVMRRSCVSMYLPPVCPSA